MEKELSNHFHFNFFQKSVAPVKKSKTKAIVCTILMLFFLVTIVTSFIALNNYENEMKKVEKTEFSILSEISNQSVISIKSSNWQEKIKKKFNVTNWVINENGFEFDQKFGRFPTPVHIVVNQDTKKIEFKNMESMQANIMAGVLFNKKNECHEENCIQSVLEEKTGTLTSNIYITMRR